MARELPPKLPGFKPKKKSACIWKFSELLDKTDAEIYDNNRSTVYIKDLNELTNNFDFFNKIFLSGYYNGVYTRDYEVLKYIEENFDKSINLYLVDDFENKDRSYIDVDSFEKSSIEIPLPYILWTNSNKNFAINQTICNFNLWAHAEEGTSPIKLEDLKRIREEVYKLADKCKDLDEIEKIIMVSDYLQDRVQFINVNNKSVSKDGVYITSGSMPTPDNIGNISNILFNGFGVCRGIAASSTILLNNPQMNVNVRDVRGGDHVWNIAKVGNKYYYVDNTWCITRNPNKYDEALKAKSFSSEYLLFGDKTAQDIGHHEIDCLAPSVEEDDYNRKMLDNKVKKLQYIAKYDDYEKPRYESYKKEDN